MTTEETHTEARHTTASGSLERITFSDEDPGEKSLLRLIEERSATGAPDTSGKTSDTREGPLADGFDDVEEEDRPRLDHLMMRLGGNGF
jgi:hypothetical protein